VDLEENRKLRWTKRKVNIEVLDILGEKRQFLVEVRSQSRPL
jgi:hypothetical protein